MSVSRETLGRDVSRETLERLEVFASLLRKWNPHINLVSRAGLVDLWSRHIDDSLQLRSLIPGSTITAYDLGAGGGFPGLVLAIATDVSFTLIEADARKAAFLQEAARLTQTKVAVLNSRIEEASLPPADMITARALAPLPKLLALGRPLLRSAGIMLFLKGKTVQAEIDDTRRAWTLRIDRHISQTRGGGVILRISEVERA